MDSFQDIFDKIDYKKNNNVKETNKTDKILTALYESISKINSRVKNISEINSSNIVLENIQDNAFKERLDNSIMSSLKTNELNIPINPI